MSIVMIMSMLTNSSFRSERSWTSHRDFLPQLDALLELKLAPTKSSWRGPWPPILQAGRRDLGHPTATSCPNWMLSWNSNSTPMNSSWQCPWPPILQAGRRNLAARRHLERVPGILRLSGQRPGSPTARKPTIKLIINLVIQSS